MLTTIAVVAIVWYLIHRAIVMDRNIYRMSVKDRNEAEDRALIAELREQGFTVTDVTRETDEDPR